MTSIFRYRLHFPHLAKYRNIAHFKRLTFNLHLYAFPCSAYHFPHRPSHVCDDDADAWRRPLYHLEVARSCRREDDTGIRQNHQSEKGRCSQSSERVVRLKHERSFVPERPYIF